jgi:hypothetical protein
MVSSFLYSVSFFSYITINVNQLALFRESSLVAVEVPLIQFLSEARLYDNQ